MHASNRRGKLGRPRILYWYRTPPGVKVGREPFDEEVRRTLEAQNPGVLFDWKAIVATPMPPADAEPWRERRRAERAAKQVRLAEEAESVDAPESEHGEGDADRGDLSASGEQADGGPVGEAHSGARSGALDGAGDGGDGPVASVAAGGDGVLGASTVDGPQANLGGLQAPGSASRSRRRRRRGRRRPSASGDPAGSELQPAASEARGEPDEPSEHAPEAALDSPESDDR